MTNQNAPSRNDHTTETATSHRVFVYGTLMLGQSNHRVLSEMSSNPWRIGRAETKPEWRMVSLGAFPGVVPGDETVYGEVWTVDDLTVLDHLEGHPRFYCREEVELADGTVAWMYVYQGPAEHAPHITGGCWVAQAAVNEWEEV